MAQSTVLAAGTTAARSSDIVATATPVTVSLFIANGGPLPSGFQLPVERKVGAAWQPVYDRNGPVRLDQNRMDVLLVGPGTYSVNRPAVWLAIGVVADTTA